MDLDIDPENLKSMVFVNVNARADEQSDLLQFKSTKTNFDNMTYYVL